MVSTRHHPRQFPPPPESSPSKAASPSKQTSEKASSPSSMTASNDSANGEVPKSVTRKRSTASRSRKSDAAALTSDPEDTKTAVVKSTSTSSSSSGNFAWVHRPSNLTLIWLMISLPLVAWDTGYVLLRPHSMPGGKLHAPIWTPYALYGTIDYIYGFPAFNARNGFTAAQATMNILESIGYIAYAYIVYTRGGPTKKKGRGVPKKADSLGWLAEGRQVVGRDAAVATVIAFSAALMSLSKTMLYGLNEAFSGFDNIGHNDAFTLVFLWIIPNGAWIVLPAYMCWIIGTEILDGLEIAGSRKSR